VQGEWSLFARLGPGRGLSTQFQGLDEPPQVTNPFHRQSRGESYLRLVAQNVGGGRRKGSRRSIGEDDDQKERSVSPFESCRLQKPAKQGMQCGRDPHLAWQQPPKMLQSVAVPPGTGKTHLAIGLSLRACQAGHRVAFATAAEWVARLAEAHNAGRLHAELTRLGRYPLIVIDEVGYIPFEAEAANLFFQLVSARYERASVIVTSNKPFGRWGEVFGDAVVAAAMIDRLVHHAEVVSMKGDSYRLKDRDLGRVPTDDAA
jgi:hypothetical protein